MGAAIDPLRFRGFVPVGEKTGGKTIYLALDSRLLVRGNIALWNIFGLDFPGELIRLAMLSYPLITFLKIPRIASRPIFTLAKTVLICAAIIYMFKLGFDRNIQLARNNAQRTNTLQDFIVKCQRAVANDPSAPIIIYSQNLGEYEPIFAIKSFLLHTGMKNPIMLELAKDFGPGGFAPAIVPMLRNSLREIEAGSSGFTARSSLNEKQACYYVGFNVVPKSGQCTAIGAVVQ